MKKKESGLNHTTGLDSRQLSTYDICRNNSYLLSSGTEHRLLDVCVHPPEGVVSPRNALQVAKRPVLVTHHFLHHGRVPGQLHGLRRREQEGVLRICDVMKEDNIDS
jgi:hypothetical protein